jgi:hypothetical protein
MAKPAKKEVAKQPALAAQGAWAAGLSSMPVFIDGLTHSLFYLIVAAKNSADKYQAVVIGKFGADTFKFYGSFEEWGFTAASLEDKFGAEDILSRKGERAAGYERYFTNRRGVEAILKALGETRNVTVAPLAGIYKAYDIPYETRKEISLAAHPARGGYRPLLPFKSVPLLNLSTPKQQPAAHA